MPPAGWYADPADPTQLRYWDGARWTVHVAPAISGSTAATQLVAMPASSGVDPDLSTERVEQLSGRDATRLAVLPPPTTEPAWYSDPLNRLQARVWDGGAWTGRVAACPLTTLPAAAPQPVATSELGRGGVHWPSARENRYLARCTPQTPGWYLDPLAPALRARRWDTTWSEEVRPLRDVPNRPLSEVPAPPVRLPGYGDPEDVARTRRSLVAWSTVGVLFLAGGTAELMDPRASGGSLWPLILGAGAFVRAHVAHTKLRDLGQG